MAAGKLDSEVAGFSAAHAAHAAHEDLAAVTTHFFTAGGDQLRRGTPFTTEVAMHMQGGAVARLPGIDDDHGPALAPELKRGGKPGG